MSYEFVFLHLFWCIQYSSAPRYCQQKRPRDSWRTPDYSETFWATFCFPGTSSWVVWNLCCESSHPEWNEQIWVHNNQWIGKWWLHLLARHFITGNLELPCREQPNWPNILLRINILIKDFTITTTTHHLTCHCHHTHYLYLQVIVKCTSFLYAEIGTPKKIEQGNLHSWNGDRPTSSFGGDDCI